MFIHLGNKIQISDQNCLGIFNIDTLRLSSDNNWIINKVNDYDKVIAIDNDGKILSSEISSYTIIKRIAISNYELVWSKGNE